MSILYLPKPERGTAFKSAELCFLPRLKAVGFYITRKVFMINPQQVEAMIKAEMPDAQIQVQDLTGGGDHYQVTVVSSQFADKGLVQQHQLVYGALRQAMSTEAIHALAVKTYTPEAWQATAAS
jgi:acid stress-induced BolA-like protein IbaG/YrbA